jgi:folate-binding Fe-S cluster repair protein YgfZ
MDAAATCWAWHPEGPCRLEQPVWLLQLDGADALRFLHGQSSQAIALAPAGSALATCLISPTARMRALARVLVDDQGAWLLIETGDPEAVRGALDRVLFPADQVQLGPLQQALLVTLLGEDNLLSNASLLGDQPQGEPGRWQPLSATTWLVEQQVLLQGAAAADPAADPDAHPLLSNSRPLSALEQERWRIQQGWPAAPGELNAGTNPFELGLAARVRQTPTRRSRSRRTTCSARCGRRTRWCRSRCRPSGIPGGRSSRNRRWNRTRRSPATGRG